LTSYDTRKYMESVNLFCLCPWCLTVRCFKVRIKRKLTDHDFKN